MNCPVCEDTRMREVEKNGILIDICPTCKGVWLDRGELDKLMQDVREVRQDYNEWYYGDSQGRQEGARTAQPQQQPYPPSQQPYPPQHQQYPQHPHGHSPYSPYKKKKKSVMDMFGDLFD
ncbi:zf-TFIIB domain-containing protein [Cohnella boryungensis]|uniref:Zf-TFIIB domain-containing protein n=1 Tax=Cohnella boryungensis TaxID=768479 RepID=A0ABV8SHX1_9BACL